jgi:Mn-dependent DtxR family transcriptional regulator
MTQKQWHEKAHLAVRKLISLKNELSRLGLLRTMHKLDISTTEIGWEMADIITGKQKTVDCFLKRRKK